MRTYQPVALPKLKRVATEKGRRYETPEGKLYPSVTTIFSALPNKYLDEWKERLGDEATKIANRAAKRGTYIHEQCESLLTGAPAPKDAFSKMLYGDLWKSFQPVVNQIGDVFAIETPLFSDELAVAGTVDCIGIWEGELSVIDFKTSTRRKSATDIDNYFMQTACYAQMWEEQTGQPIDTLVILMAVEDDQPLIFKEQKSNWIDRFKEARVQYKLKIGD